MTEQEKIKSLIDSLESHTQTFHSKGYDIEKFAFCLAGALNGHINLRKKGWIKGRTQSNLLRALELAFEDSKKQA